MKFIHKENGKKYIKIFGLKICRDKNIKGFSENITNSLIECNTKIYNPKCISDTKISKGTYIAQNACISKTNIGKYCSIGPNFMCGWGIHPTDGISTHPAFYSTLKQNGMTYAKVDKITERKEINIGNDVHIGMNVCVLDGVNIGDGAVIAAGAVVTSDIEPYSIAGGVPAKHIKYRFDSKTIESLLKIKWWDFDDKNILDVEKMFFNVEAFIKKYEK